ncbi:hypothetical protein [Hydrogenimonas sp.]
MDHTLKHQAAVLATLIYPEYAEIPSEIASIDVDERWFTDPSLIKIAETIQAMRKRDVPVYMEGVHDELSMWEDWNVRDEMAFVAVAARVPLIKSHLEHSLSVIKKNAALYVARRLAI